MAHIIQAENIVANYFDQNPEKDSITIETISAISKKLTVIFKDINIYLYVDNTRDAIINMLNISPDLFERSTDKKEILLKNRSQLQTEVTMYFNAKLDREIKETYLQLMENFKEPV